MALTTNQGLILPDGTDNANVPLTFTDFVTTAGSGMENRLVQRYLSIADRTARNPAPNEGELSYLMDLNRYDTYTGAAWVSLYPQHVYASDTTAYNTSSVAYTTAGATVLGAATTVPQSGQIRVDWALTGDQTVAGTWFLAPQLNSGSVVGAGAPLVAVADAVSISNGTQDSTGMGSFTYYTGLTPGIAVNAFLQHRVTAGTASLSNRRISISQA